MRSSKKIDMTTGSIMKQIILFALPICAGNILQQLYNTVDTLVIGNYCDSASLAAVGTSAFPVEMLLCIFLGLGTGVSILVSQYTGSGDNENLKKVIQTATTFLYMCAIPVSVLGLFIGPLILKFMQVPADAWDYSVTYIRIIFLGTLGNMGYNMNAGILRGLGDSHSSLIFLLISCVVNIVLDLLFVAQLDMGVSGVALATAIAMFSSWVFSIIYIKKRYPELNFSALPRGIHKDILSDIVRIGLPLGLNNSIYSIGHILLQSLINAQGTAFMAGYSVGTKLTGLANVAITSLSSAATTFAGQNLGAKNYKRLKAGGIRIPLFSGIITITFAMIMLYFGRPILSMFTDDPEVLAMGMHYIRVFLPFTWMYAVFNGIICFANGLKVVRYPTIVNILTLWAVRIPVAHLIVRFFEGIYVIAAVPISFLFGMICMLCFFGTRHWKEILKLAKVQENEELLKNEASC